VCQESTTAIKWLNAVDKMMVGPQSRCIGDGSKPPKGALINSFCAERLGESNPRG